MRTRKRDNGVVLIPILLWMLVLSPLAAPYGTVSIVGLVGVIVLSFFLGTVTFWLLKGNILQTKRNKEPEA